MGNEHAPSNALAVSGVAPSPAATSMRLAGRADPDWPVGSGIVEADLRADQRLHHFSEQTHRKAEPDPFATGGSRQVGALWAPIRVDCYSVMPYREAHRAATEGLQQPLTRKHGAPARRARSAQAGPRPRAARPGTGPPAAGPTAHQHRWTTG